MEKFIFQQIADHIEQQIKTGILSVGEKLPSLRQSAIIHKASLNSVLNAYFELERRGLIASRPKSGYYVCRQWPQQRQMPKASKPREVRSQNELSETFLNIYANGELKGINLSSTQVAPELLPVAMLKKEVTQALHALPHGGAGYGRYGNEKLKAQVARRSQYWGGTLQPADVIPTSGCFDAITLCITALLKRGDTIGVESPVHFGIINLARSLGINIIELATNPDTGLDIDNVRKIVAAKKIDMLLVMGNFSNPFGSLMPDAHKKKLARLVQQYRIPMIEDDIYSDIYFGQQYPTFCKTFDEAGFIMLCGSVSKTLAGGYRVGWLVPGKFKDKIIKANPYYAVNCNTVTHEAIAGFFGNNRYDKYLGKLNHTLYYNALQFSKCIEDYFPHDTKVTKPEGGTQLWVEFDKRVDTMQLYNAAMEMNINISPGRIYTLQHQYNNCIRLGFGTVWNSKIESALKQVGRLAKAMYK